MDEPRGGRRGARPANLTRLSIYGLHGWPRSPVGQGSPADQSAQGVWLATGTALSRVAGLPEGCGRCGCRTCAVRCVWLASSVALQQWLASRLSSTLHESSVAGLHRRTVWLASIARLSVCVWPAHWAVAAWSGYPVTSHRCADRNSQQGRSRISVTRTEATTRSLTLGFHLSSWRRARRLAHSASCNAAGLPRLAAAADGR